MATESEVGRDNYCKVIGHDWHVETHHGALRLRCGNRCWIDRAELWVVPQAKIIALFDLLDNWNRMTKTPSPTVEQIMEALGLTLDAEGKVTWAH